MMPVVRPPAAFTCTKTEMIVNARRPSSVEGAVTISGHL
jgi:hypothetical protein